MLVKIRKASDVNRHLRGRAALPSKLAITTSFSPNEGDIELLFHPKLEFLQLWFTNKRGDDSNTWWATHLLRTTRLRALTNMQLRHEGYIALPRTFPKVCFSSTLGSTLKVMSFSAFQYGEKECILLGRALPSLHSLHKFGLSSGNFYGPLGNIITVVLGVPEFSFGAFVHSHKSSLVVLNSLSQRSPKKGGKRIFYLWVRNSGFELPLLKLVAAAIEKCPTTKINRSCVVRLFTKDHGFLQKLQYMHH